MNAEQIRSRLKSKQTQDRIQAVKSIVGLASPERQALFLEALADKSPYVAALAAEALGEQADDKAALAMTEKFGALCTDGIGLDPGCHIRANLAFSLGRLEYYPASDMLRVGIRTVQVEAVGGVPFDTAAHLRANCALALAQIRDQNCVRDISLLLFDRSGFIHTPNDPTVKMEPRKAAARALSITGSSQARLPLTLKLVHPENEQPEVLQECMQALVELEDPFVLDVLAPYLRHSDRRLAAFSALMIAQSQLPGSTALLAGAIASFSGDALKAVILALATIRDPDAYEQLHHLAKSDREAVRLAVIDALPPDDASQAILKNLASRDPSPRVKAAAKMALRMD
ncbi:MAG: HEAT repeat domain-containing protein [Janthinobacterium lividum]